MYSHAQPHSHTRLRNRSRPRSYMHAHNHSHTLTHALTFSFTLIQHTFTPILNHTHTCTYAYKYTHSHTHKRTHPHAQPHSYMHYALTQLLTLFKRRRSTRVRHIHRIAWHAGILAATRRRCWDLAGVEKQVLEAHDADSHAGQREWWRVTCSVLLRGLLTHWALLFAASLFPHPTYWNKTSSQKGVGRDLTRVRHGDFGDLIRVEPNLAFATFQDRGREPAGDSENVSRVWMQEIVAVSFSQSCIAKPNVSKSSMSDRINSTDDHNRQSLPY